MGLLDGDRLAHLGLLFLYFAWEFDVQHPMLHLCLDVALVHIVGQYECLLKLRVGEFAAQVFALLLVAALLFLLFALFAVLVVAVAAFLDYDYQVAGLVEVYAKVIFRHARRSYLYLIFVFLLDDVDGWCCCFCSSHPVGVEEVTEDARHPFLMVHSFHWGHS